MKQSVLRPVWADTMRSWVAGTMATIALTAVYAVVQLHDDNIAQDHQINRLRAQACPDTWRDMSLAFVTQESVALERPRYSRIACYYAKGVRS